MRARELSNRNEIGRWSVVTDSGRARSTAGRGTVGGAHWTFCGLMVRADSRTGGRAGRGRPRNCICTFELTSHFAPLTPDRGSSLFALAGSSAQCWPSFLLLSPQQNPNFFFPRCRPPTRSGQSTRTRSQRSRPSSQTGTKTTSSRPSTTPEGHSTPPSTESRPVSPAFLFLPSLLLRSVVGEVGQRTVWAWVRVGEVV